MSMITDKLLEERLTKMLREAGDPRAVQVRESPPETVRFVATVGGVPLEFRIPADVLQGSPLDFVETEYLAKLRQRFGPA